MKSTTHTPEQIIKIIEQAEKGEQRVVAICREHGIAEHTVYRWRKAYGGMAVNEVQRLKELEKENSRLTRLLAERVLEIDLRKELLEKRLNVTEQRAAVPWLVTGGLSVPRACALIQVPRATFRYVAQPKDDTLLLAQIRELVARNPRYGYRRITARLRRSSRVNEKRVRRLWRQHRLQVQRMRRRRLRLPRPARLEAGYPGQIWADDFVEDARADSTPLRILTVMDAFTREGLALDVALTTSAERVMGVLTALIGHYSAPVYLRSDNGAEFVATAVQTWLAQGGIQTLYIDPGKPWQNGKEERFHGTVRDECLNLYQFYSVAGARVRLSTFHHHYNHERPHSRLGYLTPLAFKIAWDEAQANQLDPHIET